MASLIYNSFFYDVCKGSIDCDSDSFKMLLVTASYTPNRDTHAKRSSITNEVTGTGYTAGGAAVTRTVTQNNTDDRIEIAFSTVTWTTATISLARAAVVYKARGGASSADELVVYLDFGSAKSSDNADFEVVVSTPLYIEY